MSDIRHWVQDIIDSITDDMSYGRPVRVRVSRARRNKKKKFLRRHIWDAFDNQFSLREIMDKDKNIFLGVSDVEDLITAEVLQRRSAAEKSTVHRQTSVLCNRERWQSWAEQQFTSEYLFVQSSSSCGFIVEKSTDNLIKFDVNSNTTDIRAFGDQEFADKIINLIEQNFDIVTAHIEWVYSPDGGSCNIPLNRDRLPVAEMYPFLKEESLESYYERYMDSSANILLLIGPPGTGKTTFIRGLLSHTNSSAIVSYDSAILEKDGFFARFIESDDNVMVLEDSDAFLMSRTEGNTMMHRFLNVGDGLVTTKGKKMIFSTNLPSIRDIDPALVRPGRCFDIVTFAPLEISEAQALADKLGVKLPVRPRGKETTPYSIAEVFNEQTNKPKERKVGFI